MLWGRGVLRGGAWGRRRFWGGKGEIPTYVRWRITSARPRELSASQSILSLDQRRGRRLRSPPPRPTPPHSPKKNKDTKRAPSPPVLMAIQRPADGSAGRTLRAQAEQSRTGQCRAEPGNAEQSQAMPRRAEQSRAKPSRAEQSWVKRGQRL